jgi:hypothetical protein
MAATGGLSFPQARQRSRTAHLGKSGSAACVIPLGNRARRSPGSMSERLLSVVELLHQILLAVFFP